jgi:hypothetical protein
VLFAMATPLRCQSRRISTPMWRRKFANNDARRVPPAGLLLLPPDGKFR